MNCCINCFKDSEICSIIESYQNIGNCDFCGAKNALVYDIYSQDNPIASGITEIINIYSTSSSKNAKPLKHALCNDWDIFNLGSESLLSLVKKLCILVYDENDSIYFENVEIIRLTNNEFLNQVAIAGGKTWKEFSEYIKSENRFHANMFNAEMFGKYLENAEKKYDKDTLMYRARICSKKEGFKKTEIGPPPPNKRTSGRVNPEGIGVLYLSLDKETVLNETRASSLDFVTIGKFRLNQKAKIVNLSEISKISPFLFIDDLEQYAVNRKVFQEIALEISKPLRRSDSSLEYLPTQFITEFIKSKGYVC